MGRDISVVSIDYDYVRRWCGSLLKILGGGRKKKANGISRERQNCLPRSGQLEPLPDNESLMTAAETAACHSGRDSVTSRDLPDGLSTVRPGPAGPGSGAANGIGSWSHSIC
jgi:hypothetical protein